MSEQALKSVPSDAEAVRDPVWKHIYIDGSLMQACRTPAFLRLFRIKQLGPAEIVYPGATHTRAAHSYGVYHVATRLADVLLQKGAASWISRSGLASFLAAALFHDLGHFPYAHSLKELSLAEHEELTARLILTEPLKSLAAKTGADPAQTAAIVNHKAETADTETLFFRKLLSGVLDPDKLDYLNRDAFFCGVPYGIQDTDFVLSRLIPDRERGICLDAASALAVESILFAKYLMYRSVYWHKTVRIATAMMKKCIYLCLSSRCISPEDLYALDDSGLFLLIESKRFTGKNLAGLVRDRRLFTILAEIPFDGGNPAHANLENLQNRCDFETLLAQKAGIGGESILIDIPERISFESDLWVRDEHCVFSESSTVLQAQTIRSFSGTLRKIRLAADPGVLAGTREKQVLVAEFLKL